MIKKKTIKILLVEDDEDDYIFFKEYLKEIKNANYELTWAPSFEQGVEFISSQRHDIYVFDYLLGKNTGIDLITRCNSLGIQAPIILLTGLGNQDTDMKAMEMGAADYLVKGEINAVTLERSLRYALEQSISLKKIKASENKFRTIFENSYDVIYIAKQDGTIVDINNSGDRLFGYNREELLRMNAVDLYDNKEDRSKFIEAMSKTGIASNYELTLKDKTGNKKYCLITANIQKIDENGDIYHQGIIRDITRRKKIEKDLVIAEKFAVTGRVVRTLAHEVRNPLTNIYLAMEQLEEEIKTDALAVYSDIIKRNSDRINNIIKELLQHSSQSEVKISRHSVNDILNETIALARDRAILKNIKIKTNLEKAPCYIMADGEKLKIALSNIMVNAIEAVDENKGEINIRTTIDNDKVNIEIEDNGSGISNESMEKIFEPYYTKKPNGLGLGLATTHNIIQSMNGSIDIESEIKKGSKFIVHLNC